MCDMFIIISRTPANVACMASRVDRQVYIRQHSTAMSGLLYFTLLYLARYQLYFDLVLAMASRKSVIWRVFNENPIDKTRAICVLCNENVACGGSSIASFFTSNLWQHLLRSHKTEHEQLKEDEKSGKTSAQLFVKHSLPIIKFNYGSVSNK